MRFPTVAGALALVVAVTLTGCTTDPLAEQYGGGGAELRCRRTARTARSPRPIAVTPVVFEGTTDTGMQVSNDDYAGEVLVVNFWYAECAALPGGGPGPARPVAEVRGQRRILPRRQHLRPGRERARVRAQVRDHLPVDHGCEFRHRTSRVRRARPAERRADHAGARQGGPGGRAVPGAAAGTVQPATRSSASSSPRTCSGVDGRDRLQRQPRWWRSRSPCSPG